MDESRKAVLYRKGQDIHLDKAFSRYKRMRLWSGGALTMALTENEIDTLVELWKKAKFSPRKLSVDDVQKLVDFADHITSCRRRIKAEKTRRRMEKSRAKSRRAARSGKAGAKKKTESKKITVEKKGKREWLSRDS